MQLGWVGGEATQSYVAAMNFTFHLASRRQDPDIAGKVWGLDGCHSDAGAADLDGARRWQARTCKASRAAPHPAAPAVT